MGKITKKEKGMIQCEIVFTNIKYPRVNPIPSGEWISAIGKITKIIRGLEKLQEFGVIQNEKDLRYTNIQIVGKMCAFDKAFDFGKSFKLTANIIEDDKYGIQLDILFISSIEKYDDKDSQYKFLATILTPSQIDLLYKNCDNPFSLIEEGNIEELTKIKGIGLKKAQDILKKFERGRDNSKAYIELFEMGFNKNRIDNLVEQFGSPDTLVEIIKDNPYRLIDLVDHFGWETADALALNSGINPLSEKRIEAYIFYYLQQLGYGGNQEENGLSGSTWVEFMELYNTIIDKFEELHPDNNPNLLIDCIKKMLKKKDENNPNEKPRLKMIKVPTGTYDENGREIYYRKVALYKFWELEDNIAKELLRIQSGEVLKGIEPDEAIKFTETLQGFEYTDEQKEGIKTVLNNQVAIITGKAGCGKTTVVNGMLAALPNCSKELTSFSGQAASRLSEVTNIEGKTIHRLLRYVQGNGFMINERNPLNTDIVIVDECSMLSLDLFHALLKAIPTGTKLIMLGDNSQLPAIGLGSLLRDMIESNVISKVILTKIHRQSAKSGIITQSLKVSEGTQLVKNREYIEETRGELQDFKIITYEESQDTQDILLNEFKRLYFEENIPIDQIQIIVPLRKHGKISTNELNPIIQEMVNPTTELNADSCFDVVINEGKDSSYKYTLKDNDKIRINTNTYRNIFNYNGEETPIFNGNLGMIEKLDLFLNEMGVDLGYMGKVNIPKTLWKIVSLSYASSCHSSQGSEFPYVIVALDYSAYTLLNRNWLYSSLTRAKKHCILIAQETALRYAINHSAVDNKRTFLKDILIEYKQKLEQEKKNKEEDY